jgi:hypothetical protein
MLKKLNWENRTQPGGSSNITTIWELAFQKKFKLVEHTCEGHQIHHMKFGF